MSRGHGSRQRAVVDRLCADESARKEGVPLAALRPILPPDRSNRRRTIRTLAQRGDAVIVDDPETGEPRLKLPFLVCMREWWKREPPEYGRRGDRQQALDKRNPS